MKKADEHIEVRSGKHSVSSTNPGGKSIFIMILFLLARSAGITPLLWIVYRMLVARIP